MRSDLARVSFEPYVKGDLDGVSWQDAKHAGPRRFVVHLDSSLESGGPCETMRYDGAPVAGLGFVRASAEWWHGAVGMVEGAPRPAWRYVVRRTKDWIAHAVRHCGVRCVETRVVGTFAEGHHLVAALGFRFVGWEQGLDGTSRLFLRYQTMGPRPMPEINKDAAMAMRDAHRALLAAYAPAALRAFDREARHG